jgi:hypothetical protein
MYLPDARQNQLNYRANNSSNYALAQLLHENYGIVYKFMPKLIPDPQLAADITRNSYFYNLSFLFFWIAQWYTTII